MCSYSNICSGRSVLYSCPGVAFCQTTWNLITVFLAARRLKMFSWANATSVSAGVVSWQSAGFAKLETGMNRTLPLTTRRSGKTLVSSSQVSRWEAVKRLSVFHVILCVFLSVKCAETLSWIHSETMHINRRFCKCASLAVLALQWVFCSAKVFNMYCIYLDYLFCNSAVKHVSNEEEKYPDLRAHKVQTTNSNLSNFSMPG